MACNTTNFVISKNKISITVLLKNNNKNICFFFGGCGRVEGDGGANYSLNRINFCLLSNIRYILFSFFLEIKMKIKIKKPKLQTNINMQYNRL